MVRPIRYDGVFPYLSKIILCASTLTNWPRIKYTPSSIAAEELAPVASEVTSVADKLPAAIEPLEIALSTDILSPVTNLVVTPAVEAPTVPAALAVIVAVLIYFM